MTDFFMTRMGQKFYERDVPALVKQLADLNANLKQYLQTITQEYRACSVETAIKTMTGSQQPVEETPTFGERYAEFKGAVPMPVPDVHVAVGPEAVADVVAGIDTSVLLRNLLATIHRDGGHHTDEVGIERSVEEAHRKIVELNSQFEEMRNVVRTWSSK